MNQARAASDGHAFNLGPNGGGLSAVGNDPGARVSRLYSDVRALSRRSKRSTPRLMASLVKLLSQLAGAVLRYTFEAACVDHRPHCPAFILVGDKVAISVSIFQPSGLGFLQLCLFIVLEFRHELTVDLVEDRICGFVCIGRALGHLSLSLRIRAGVGFLLFLRASGGSRQPQYTAK
jgi:hypothetical protein